MNRRVFFTFDGIDHVYPGWTDDTTWNGFLNVEVDREVHDLVIADMEASDDDGDASAFEGLVPNERMRVSYANGFATTAVDPSEPAYKLARAFLERLRTKEGLTSAQFREIKKRNRTEEYRNPPSCATHDFCDANMPMIEAYEEVIGKIPDEVLADDGIDRDIWNHAWAIAIAMIDGGEMGV